MFLLTPAAVPAQDAGPFANGIEKTVDEMSLSCRQFRGPRDPAPLDSKAVLKVRDGELQIETGQSVVYRIPGAAQRQALVARNGSRPGADHVYYVDKAETGTGYFWFRVEYDDQSRLGNSQRNELFVDESGNFVSFTFIAREAQARPEASVREVTVRCEPS